MLLKLVVMVTDPHTGASQVVSRTFDSTNATQAKWNGLYPDVQAAAQAVIAEATPKQASVL